MPEALLTGIWVGYSALLGLLTGSFLNVCIYRLPARITIVRGHSFCPNCKHPLGALDLVPVLSYLLLGRRCRYCREPISSRYIRIELLTGAYFALAAWCWRPGHFNLPDYLLAFTGQTSVAASFEAALVLTALATLVFSGLLVWAMISWDEQIVPNGIFFFVLPLVLLRLALQPERLASHLAALLLSMLVVLFLAMFRLLPESTVRQRLQLGAGLGLLGLMAGLPAIQPVLAVCLIELLLIAVRSNRLKSGGERQADLLWRSLPLQALVVGSVTWLFL
jgi:leader peptidase (prepilin peptidase)/N-methyltransferase